MIMMMLMVIIISQEPMEFKENNVNTSDKAVPSSKLDILWYKQHFILILSIIDDFNG